jgi:aspartate/methionine/tyrosine aminotransferase
MSMPVASKGKMSPIRPFLLERYFARYEFNAPYLLSPSDCESLLLNDLLEMADPDCTAMWVNLTLGYTESAGHPLLREEISKLYEKIQPQNVLVVNPEEGIFLTMQTLLSPGDDIVAIHPAYQSLHEVARLVGANVIPWELIPDRSSWRIDLQALESSITPRTRLLVINFPHNPTGFLPGLRDLKAIVDIARRHHLYLFSDEMYRMLEYAPGQRLPGVCDLYEMGISLSGMSKAFAMPGLRIGWLATRNAGVMEHYQTFRDYTTICNSAPAEVLGLIGLRSKEQILERNLKIIQKNITAAEQFFSTYPDLFTWMPPQAGSTAFPRWLGSPRSDEFCESTVEKKGVMIVPGSMFDYPGGHFRVGLGRRNFTEALARVDAYLKEEIRPAG